MSRIPSQLKQKDELLIHPPPLSPPSSLSFPYSSTNYEKESTPSSSVTRISPALLLTIVILAVIFFISGLLHLLVRFLMKRPSSSSIYQYSNRYPETSASHALQRQLQQLFRLHDSGLDQSFIDALPVFYYKNIMGLKEPFDCAVCLCEFSDQDKLRLLPICSHAFHINCIDTWLLSNSTCPICRGTLLSSGLAMQNPVLNFDNSREISTGFPSDGEQRNGFSCGQKPVIIEESDGEKRVFPVRLGKFRSLDDGGESGERGEGEISSSYLDARRCYSMGSFQYVVGDSYMQVALSQPDSAGGGGDAKLVKVRGQNGNSSVNGDEEGKKISRTKGESFSVSKIWLWSKKSRFSSSSHTHTSVPSSLNVNLPSTDSTQAV